MRQHELEARSARRRSAPRAGGSTSGAARTRRGARPATTSTSSTCWTTCRSGTPAAWYWPQPQIENGDSRSSCQPKVRSPNTRAACSGSGSSSRTENAASVASGEAERRSAERAAATRSGTTSQSGASSSAANFVQPASATRRAARRRGRREPEAPDQERGHDRVVRVRVRDVERERVRRPGEREHRRQPRARRSASPTSARPSRQSASKSERRRVRRPQLVPLPGPAEDRVAGHVREVRDRAVRVAARVRALAAPVRLDPLADLALGVRRAARLPVVLDRHVAVGRSGRGRSGPRRSPRRSRRRSRSASPRR